MNNFLPGGTKYNYFFYFIQAILSVFLFFGKSYSQSPADPSSIVGKVVCGYQAWFTCTGDGSPANHWTHWAPNNAPQAGITSNPNPNLDFDAYPDVSFYNPASLFQTNFANLGDGSPAQLFSSYKLDVIDKHFQLLQANGIDGVAFQRFIWEVESDPYFHATRDTAAIHVRKSAEKYQRMFYLTYDLAGLGNVAGTDSSRFAGIKSDWLTDMVGNLQITSSPMYARQGGKPVVQIWGIGYNHIIGSAAIQLDLINWFKAQGCYVIIGVSPGWRTETPPANVGWTNTYLAANMISPWAVGAYTDSASADWFKANYLIPDKAYCATNGLDYQPVIFPGFSWSNWNGGAQNQIPRNKGNFLWHQATNLRSLGITTAEIGSLDEYDEGTAILPMADGYDMIPTDQYFVTTSADSSYLSSDFYLRLASKVSRVIKGLDGPTASHTVPYSAGPVYFRTSNEVKYDAQPTWTNTTDLLSNVTAYGSNSGSPGCTTILENPHRGQYSLKITGRDKSSITSYAYFKVYDVNIPVTATTDLSFWTYPLNSLGRYISIDLIMTDGITTLRSSGAVDFNGVSMHPATGRGTVNTWTKTICNIGKWLNGKTINKILVAYDNGPSTGDFSGYIDDIAIHEGSFVALPVKLMSFTAIPLNNSVKVQWEVSEENNLKQYEVQRCEDGIHFITKAIILPSGVQAFKKSYSFIDTDIFLQNSNTSRFYYRLKTLDMDGGFTYSDIHAVNFPKKSRFIVTVFPNPFTDKVELTVDAPKDDYLSAVITDVSGKNLINTRIKISNGDSKVSINNLGDLLKGIYFLKVVVGDNTQTYKIEK